MSATPSVRARFERELDRIHRGTDRMMLVILLSQWALAILIAVTLSPYSWAGKVRSIHLHVQIAVLVGAALNSLPIYLILRHPGWWFTRHVVAFSQMMWSGLLIHLTGGRIETHFHVFGSLAFLAFYRDWKILPTATFVVTADHLVRGLLLPESVYGTISPEWWRFLEHAFWVLFEDIVLFLGCRRGVSELWRMAEREAALADLNVTLERRVAERTVEVEQANASLQATIEDLRTAQRQVGEASRRAGMAEVATSVLHNVGNVLNSVNVSAGIIRDGIKRSKISGLAKATQMLSAQPDPGAFLSGDEKGKRLPGYLSAVSAAIESEHRSMLTEAESLQKNVEHIRVIIGMQQRHAKGAELVERVDLGELVEEAVNVTVPFSGDRAVEVVRDHGDAAPVVVDRHRVFQILVNLLSNARQAIAERGTIRIATRRSGDSVVLTVEDDGCGIAPEHLTRVFTLGFSTKKDGHGFGLHGSACHALEMGGRLTARSDGEGRGAVLTLELPIEPAARSRSGGAPRITRVSG